MNRFKKNQLLKFIFALTFFCTTIGLIFLALCFILPLLPEPIGSRSQLFIDGTRSTLFLTIISGFLGLFIGTIVSLARLNSNPIIRYPAFLYILLIQGTPLLVQIFIIYYVFPVLIPSLKLSEFTTSILALSLNVGAYNAEVIRAGISAIPKGQIEAAWCLGFSKFKTMRWIILPQAFRIIIPPLMNNWVALLKDSSLVSSIGLLELTLAGNRITSETFLPVPVLMTVALIYFIFTVSAQAIVSFLKRRFSTL